MKMNAHPVHRYMSLVQCPVCRSRYMEEGDACCWDCLADLDPSTTPEALTQDRERLHAAVHRLHAARLEAEADSGALGSMSGMGFVPWGTEIAERPSLSPEPGRPMPVFAPTYASDTGWRGGEETQPAEPLEGRAMDVVHTLHAGQIILGAAGGVLVLSLLLFAVAALIAGLAFGAIVYVGYRLLHDSRR